MMLTSASNRRRLQARLPSGHLLAVGTDCQDPDLVRCPGPDARGHCPILLNGAIALCDGATWFHVDQPERQFSFSRDLTQPESVDCTLAALYAL